MRRVIWLYAALIKVLIYSVGILIVMRLTGFIQQPTGPTFTIAMLIAIGAFILERSLRHKAPVLHDNLRSIGQGSGAPLLRSFRGRS